MVIVREAGDDSWRGLGRTWGRSRGSAAGTTSCSWSTRVLVGGGDKVHLRQPGRGFSSVCTPYPGQECEAHCLAGCLGLPGRNRTRQGAVTIVTGNWFNRHRLVCGIKGETKPPF